MVNNPLIRHYFLGGVAFGEVGTLDSHDAGFDLSGMGWDSRAHKRSLVMNTLVIFCRFFSGS